jgi:soluble P-type ATPase
MTPDDADSRVGARGVVAFDNSGTLSDPVVAGTETGDDPAFQQAVPEIPPERPAALVSIALEEYAAFGTDEPLGRVVDDAAFPVGLALSNVTTTPEDARDAVVADDVVPARTVAEQVEELVGEVSDRFPGREPPIGVQLVVDLDAGRIHRVLAYTTVPRPVAPAVVDAVREIGYEPHIVSGDAEHILHAVADAVSVPTANVFPYQSASDKADTLATLRGAGGDIVMVGDYVNDRYALDAADVGILIDDGGADPELTAAADDTVPTIDEVPEALDE